MAATDPPGAAAPAAAPPVPLPSSGDEPLTADLRVPAQSPRVSTRALVYAVAAFALVVLVAAVVALVVLHQPRLAPLPVPSVSSIA